MAKTQEQIDQLIEVVHEASEAILDVYNSGDFHISMKPDNTPVTQADLIAHEIVTSGLERLFENTPIVSEEGDESFNQINVMKKEFWLVDPLDGTKGFIARSGHFAVCAALIEDNVPTFGIISAPVEKQTYYGGPDIGAYKVDKDGNTQPISVRQNQPGIVLHSRSRYARGPDSTSEYIDKTYSGFDRQSIGSQLKLTAIAEGRADAYPRLDSPLCLWDLAAGHAILAGAGGRVTRFDGRPVNYQEPSLKVGDFIATN